MMLHKNLLPADFHLMESKHTVGRVGLYHFDMSSTVTGDTWTSAYAAVQTALTATEAALNLSPPYSPRRTKRSEGQTAATFALIRPPGHHATTNLCGGYCYLNNVVICASHIVRQNPSLKSVIIDVDFHHGNGVEEILAREDTDGWRQRCKYISLHAHPEYPYYTTHLPTPLLKTVSSDEYIEKLHTNLAEAEKWCDGDIFVFVSLGLDTLSGDPVGGFSGIKGQQDYVKIGREIGRFVRNVNGKSCFLLEGGYVVERLGECVEGVFRGFMAGVTNI
jgi:acetoin utilization deacetylase AcuC-like enzyme